VTFNGESILDTYDKDEQAYTATMTEGAAVVSVVYATAEVSLSDGSNYYIQIPVGTELKVSDYASYTVEGRPSDELIWTVEYQEPENTVEFTDDTNQTVIAKNAARRSCGRSRCQIDGSALRILQMSMTNQPIL
jgi:hypothetical protein